jgi:hypothetical protein
MTFVGAIITCPKGCNIRIRIYTVFPVWAWILILSIIALMVFAGLRQRFINKMAG